MARISLEAQPDGTFVVEVSDGKHETSHSVSVPDGLRAEIWCEHVEEADLVRRSFEFLLEREPATSILRRFSLSQITDYFPEYPAEIRRRLSS